MVIVNVTEYLEGAYQISLPFAVCESKGFAIDLCNELNRLNKKYNPKNEDIPLCKIFENESARQAYKKAMPRNRIMTSLEEVIGGDEDIIAYHKGFTYAEVPHF